MLVSKNMNQNQYSNIITPLHCQKKYFITSRGKTQDSLLNEYLIKSHIETIPGLGTGLLFLLSVGNEIDQTSAIY